MKTSTAIGLGVLALVGTCILGVVILFGSLFVRNFIVNFYRVQQSAKLDSIDLRRIHEAETAIRHGKGNEALTAIAPLDVLGSNRGCLITLIRASAICMTEGSCSNVFHAIEYGRFTTRIHNSDELHEKLLSYCAATSRYASPKAAAELIDLAMHMDSWLSPHCDLQLVQAEYCLLAGDKRRAANLCQQLWDDGAANNWNWSYVDDDGAFRKKLSSLKAQAGESDERWRTAVEIKAFPTNFTIYLQPLGHVDTKLLDAVCTNVSTFFGARTVVRPTIRLTHLERSYLPREDKYDADHLRPDMIGQLRIPANAFSVVLITGEKIGTPHIGWIYAQSAESRHLISYHVWREWELHWQIVVLSNVIVSCLSHQLDLFGTYPCVSTSSGDMDAMRRVKFAYSPAIQEKYRMIDLATAKDKAIDDYKAWGSTITSP